jgi:hypothetical protein
MTHNDHDLAVLYGVETKRLKEPVLRNVDRQGRVAEQSVAMLSSVLNSKRAIDVNIAFMRTFVKLRKMLDSHAKLAFCRGVLL